MSGFMEVPETPQSYTARGYVPSYNTKKDWNLQESKVHKSIKPWIFEACLHEEIENVL